MAPLEYYIQGGGTFQPDVPFDPSDEDSVDSGWVCMGTSPTPTPAAIIRYPSDSTIALDDGNITVFEDPDDQGEREWIGGRYWSLTPYKFKGVNFGDKTNPINIGSQTQVGIRYYSNEIITDDDVDSNCKSVTRIYAPWTLISQTVSVASQGFPSDRLLYNNQSANADAFLIIEPGTYESGTAPAGIDPTAPGPNAVYTYCGLKNDIRLSYFGPFNEGEIGYIPRIAPSSQQAIRAAIPTLPYKPEEGVYPINALTGYSPDSRSEVTMTYTITTTYRANNLQSTDTIVVTQTAYKTDTEDYSTLIKTTVAKSYFEYNINNMYTWPTDEPAFYKDDGTPIPPLLRYNARLDQYYDLERNGEGFRGLSKEEDVPLPDVDPENEPYTITGTVGTVNDLPLYAPAGDVYLVTNNLGVISDNELYLSDGDTPESTWFNITDNQEVDI